MRYVYAQRTHGFTTSSHDCPTADHAERAVDAAIVDMCSDAGSDIAAAVAFSLSDDGKVELIGAAFVDGSPAGDIPTLISFARGAR